MRRPVGCATRTRGKGVSVTLRDEKSTEWTFRRIHRLANEVAVWKKKRSDYSGGRAAATKWARGSTALDLPVEEAS